METTRSLAAVGRPETAAEDLFITDNCFQILCSMHLSWPSTGADLGYYHAAKSIISFCYVECSVHAMTANDWNNEKHIILCTHEYH